MLSNSTHTINPSFVDQQPLDLIGLTQGIINL